MLYIVVRLCVLAGIAIVFWLLFKRWKKKRPFRPKKANAFLLAAKILFIPVFVVALISFPVEQYFLRFATTEAAFSYFCWGQPIAHVSLEEGVFILYEPQFRQTGRTYEVCYLEKHEGKWRYERNNFYETRHLIDMGGLILFEPEQSSSQVLFLYTQTALETDAFIAIQDNTGQVYQTFARPARSAGYVTQYYYAVAPKSDTGYEFTIDGREFNIDADKADFGIF